MLFMSLTAILACLFLRPSWGPCASVWSTVLCHRVTCVSLSLGLAHGSPPPRGPLQTPSVTVPMAIILYHTDLFYFFQSLYRYLNYEYLFTSHCLSWLEFKLQQSCFPCSPLYTKNTEQCLI